VGRAGDDPRAVAHARCAGERVDDGGTEAHAGSIPRPCLATAGVHNRAHDTPTRRDMIHGLPPEHIALLCFAAFCGGAVDAIAGGGGLITVPALLAAGLSPHQALGTNKGQSSFGSFAAIVRYGREGLVDWKLAAIAFPLGFLGSALGATLALHLEPGVLRPIVLALLVLVGFLFASGRLHPRERSGPAPKRDLLVAAFALAIGLYDGFFGPGAGTFIVAGYAALLHLPLTRATANAKVLNFASNVAALLLFARGGMILWGLAIPMAAAQLGGGYCGAHLAIRRGDALIRGVAVAVVLALVLWIALDVPVRVASQSGAHSIPGGHR